MFLFCWCLPLTSLTTFLRSHENKNHPVWILSASGFFGGVRHQNQEHIYYPPDWAAKLDVCTVYDILKRLDQVDALYWNFSGRPDSCYYWVRIGLLTIGRPHHSMTVPTISGSPNTCTKASRPCVTHIYLYRQNLFLYFSWPGFFGFHRENQSPNIYLSSTGLLALTVWSIVVANTNTFVVISWSCSPAVKGSKYFRINRHRKNTGTNTNADRFQAWLLALHVWSNVVTNTGASLSAGKTLRLTQSPLRCTEAYLDLK